MCYAVLRNNTKLPFHFVALTQITQFKRGIGPCVLDQGRAGLGYRFLPGPAWVLGPGSTTPTWSGPGRLEAFFPHGTLRIAKLLACLLFVPKKNEALFSTDLAHPNPRAVRALRKKINFAKHTKEK